MVDQARPISTLKNKMVSVIPTAVSKEAVASTIYPTIVSISEDRDLIENEMVAATYSLKSSTEKENWWRRLKRWLKTRRPNK